jgi:hypothetical protein
MDEGDDSAVTDGGMAGAVEAEAGGEQEPDSQNSTNEFAAWYSATQHTGTPRKSSIDDFLSKIGGGGDDADGGDSDDGGGGGIDYDAGNAVTNPPPAAPTVATALGHTAAALAAARRAKANAGLR